MLGPDETHEGMPPGTPALPVATEGAGRVLPLHGVRVPASRRVGSVPRRNPGRDPQEPELPAIVAITATPTLPDRRSEQDIVRAILEAVNASGLARVWRHHSGIVKVARGFMHLAPKGSPDIVGYALDSGRFVGIEVKLPSKEKKHPERVKLQQEWRDKINAAGGIALMATDVDTVIQRLRGEAK